MQHVLDRGVQVRSSPAILGAVSGQELAEALSSELSDAVVESSAEHLSGQYLELGEGLDEFLGAFAGQPLPPPELASPLHRVRGQRSFREPVEEIGDGDDDRMGLVEHFVELSLDSNEAVDATS